MMGAWLRHRLPRVAGIIGLSALCIVDVAAGPDYRTEVTNGFWSLAGEKAFHLAFWTVWLVCCYMVLERE